ncbi:hypothetical protein HGRIS_006207 [Hohenbuehelia grisea]|uniref:MARVEL domain-containing protein n=1 Tax=Hohenbuehelia grisea TaxID=104357 RepID=A0ABR3K0B9_9AGAR
MGLANVASIVRHVVLALVIIFSLACLGISAHFLYLTEFYFGGLFYFSPLAIAVSAVSFMSLLFMFVMDLATRGRFFSSRVIFEWIWLGFLCCAWMGTAGYSAWTNQQAFDGSCDVRSRTIRTLCNELPGVIATAFLCAFFLLFYTIFSVVVVSMLPSGAASKSMRQIAADSTASQMAGQDHYKQQFQPQYGQPQMQTGIPYNQNYPDANQAAAQMPYQSTPMAYQANPAMQPPMSPASTAQYGPGSVNTYTTDAQASSAAQQGYPNYQGPTPPAGGYPPYQGNTPPMPQPGYPDYQSGTPPNAGAPHPTMTHAQPM